MGVFALDVGVFGRAHRMKRALPQVVDVGEHVGFAAQGQRVRLVPLAGNVERELQAAVHLKTGVDHALLGHLMGRALLLHPAKTRVQARRILADHHEIDVFRALVLDRGLNVRIQLDRPQVDVLVQFKTRPKENALFQNAGFHVRMTDRAQQNRVVLAEFVQRGIRENLARRQVAVAAEIVIRGIQGDVAASGGRANDLHRFRQHFRACAVATHQCNFILRHARLPLDVEDEWVPNARTAPGKAQW